MHMTMASVASLGKIEIIRSQEFMPREARLKFLKKMIILGPKTAILGPQFCRILVLGPHFWWPGGPWGPRGPLDPPLPLVQDKHTVYEFLIREGNSHISGPRIQVFYHGSLILC